MQLFTLSGPEYALVNEYVGDEVIEPAVLPGLQLTTHALFNTP